MDLEELRAFLAVIETGSFLGAERSLNMPRATVRRRVDALEARAGVPLLNKSREGIVATEAGAVLVTRGRLMIQEATALVASIREIGQEPSGVLPPCVDASTRSKRGRAFRCATKSPRASSPPRRARCGSPAGA